MTENGEPCRSANTLGLEATSAIGRGGKAVVEGLLRDHSLIRCNVVLGNPDIAVGLRANEAGDKETHAASLPHTEIEMPTI